MVLAIPFGFINAFKPPGLSSAAFGNWVKRALGGAAVGHWGTLDPAACGVLPLAVGKATRLLPLLPDSRKRYIFELVVGERTQTADASGDVIESAPVPDDWKRDLPAAAAELIGPQTQMPPMHSAVKVDGRPLYRSARLGLDVVRKPRPTVIHDLRVVGDAAAPQARNAALRAARLFVECEAGTYVRVLCEELGRRLGLPARMGALLRIGAGPFGLEGCVRPDQIAADPRACLIDPLAVLRNPRVALDEEGARRFMHGNQIRLGRGSHASREHDPEVEVLVTCGVELLGCGRVISDNGDDALVPTRVLSAPDAVSDTQGLTPEEANE